VDLTVAAADRVRSWALARPAISVLTSPHRVTLGWRVEADARSRGWGRADSPADADVLLLVGDLGTQLAPAARMWWHHMTAPRAQGAVTDRAQIDHVLDDALARLRDWQAQREEAARTDETVALLQTPDAPADRAHGAHGGHDMGGHDMGGHDMGGHGGHDMGGHGGHDMGGHGGHDMGGHGGHDMADVAGLPMAGTGEDRDGLELDVLTYRWGPFLTGWPPGLVVRATLSGDVVSAATVEAQPDAAEALPRLAAVAHSLVSVLGLAGWHRAERALSALPLAPLDGRTATDDEKRWLARVRRSRALSWALRDIADIDGQGAGGRVVLWCEELLAGDATDGTWTVVPDSELVSQVVTGTEMARARIAVASIALTPATMPLGGTTRRDAGGHRARHDNGDLS
jgi:hypothetical protein